MSPPGERSPEGRYRELDALRGFAALGVVLWHYRAHFRVVPFAEILQPFYWSGFLCVDFFFVLSGVVLTRAYLSERRRSDLAGNLVRRLARIYPLHLITLIAVALLQWVVVAGMQRPAFIVRDNDLYHFVLNLLLANFIGLQRGFSFNGPSWSISTEFFVNGIFFLLIRARTGLRLDASFLGLVVFSGFVLSAFDNGRLDRSGTVLFMQAELLRTILGFFTGALLYRWVIRGRDATGGAVADGVFVATLALLLLAALGPLRTETYAPLAAVVIGFPLLIVSAIRAPRVGRLLRLAPFTHLGDVSYSLYLIHFPVQILFFIAINGRLVSLDMSRPSGLFVYLAACYGLAALSHRYFELPAQARINAWWRARRERGTVPVGGSA